MVQIAVRQGVGVIHAPEPIIVMIAQQEEQVAHLYLQEIARHKTIQIAQD